MIRVQPELWKPQGIDDLEPNAWTALKENSRSIGVTAGAGAGKTEFLAQKAAYLLQTGLCSAPKRILAISFKRDAARNLAERVAKRCSPELSRRFDSVTFDAFTKSFIDRFRSAIPDPFSPPPDYRIGFPSRDQLQQFLTIHDFHGTSPASLERDIAKTRLPLDCETEKILQAYWNTQYNIMGDVFLTFPMINRLVDWLLRENPYIRRALHMTYPFAFFDEFQDTTYPQFELIHTAFNGSDTIFTAVGDEKQRIMGWAGAMPKAFDTFETQFNAEHITLVSNWRSHKELVRIQHVIAKNIDSEVDLPEARAERDIDGDIAAIWQYNNKKEENTSLSNWIAREVERDIPPHEIAILVRMHADNVETDLAPLLSENSIKLRNTARNVGDIAIQDLLKEDLTLTLLPLLRLGASSRDPNAWNNAQRSLQLLEAIHPDDEIGYQRLQQRLEIFVRELRNEMHNCEPNAITAACIATRTIEFVGHKIIKQVFPAYRQQRDFERVWDGFTKLLSESAETAISWTKTLDQFEGLNQVALMTIHKSKGLEFHTIIFFGLDNQTWWSLTPERSEELKSFFVALTRAKQRAFFTLCTERGGPVTWIEKLLKPAGVHRVKGPA